MVSLPSAWWRHQMATFSALLALCEGKPSVTGGFPSQRPGVVSLWVSRALQNIFSKFVCCRNRTSYEHFKLKLSSCAQSHDLATRTKFQLEIPTINVITGIVYFREIILESSRNVSGTTPSDAGLWFYLWSAPEQTIDQTTETPVIRDAIQLIVTSL